MESHSTPVMVQVPGAGPMMDLGGVVGRGDGNAEVNATAVEANSVGDANDVNNILDDTIKAIVNDANDVNIDDDAIKANVVDAAISVPAMNTTDEQA
jgi:hypothetical protein